MIIENCMWYQNTCKNEDYKSLPRTPENFPGKKILPFIIKNDKNNKLILFEYLSICKKLNILISGWYKKSVEFYIIYFWREIEYFLCFIYPKEIFSYADHISGYIIYCQCNIMFNNAIHSIPHSLPKKNLRSIRSTREEIYLKLICYLSGFGNYSDK